MAISNRFRPVFRSLQPEEVELVDHIKTKATELETLYNLLPPEKRRRYHALAMTALEESVMWAIKEVTG